MSGTRRKIAIGNVYRAHGASLQIVSEQVKNSVKCRCLVCDTVDGYKVSELKAGEVLACKNCKGDYNVGDVVGKTLVITDYAIKYDGQNNIFYFVLKCNKCNNEFMLTIESIKNIKECAKCTSVKPKIVPSSNSSMASVFGVAPTATVKPTARPKIVPPSVNNNKIQSKKEAKKANIVGNLKSFVEQPDLELNNYKIFGDFIEVGYDNRVSKTGQSVQKVIKAQCQKCARITLFTESQFKKSDGKCNKCASLPKDSNNLIENINWVGFVRHNIQVVRTTRGSDGVLIGELKCLACGYEMTAPIVAFKLEPEFTCIKCGNTPAFVVCPLCKEPHIKITPRDMYKVTNETLYRACDKTGSIEKVPVNEIRLQHEIQSTLDNIRKKYKGLTLDERMTSLNGNTVIYKFKENYIGTDGLVYNSCMCELHNKLMVLTDDEILNYDHEYCADTRMMAYRPKERN